MDRQNCRSRRGIATLIGLILVIPVIFGLALFTTSISTTLYHMLVVHHAMGAAIRQISLPLSAEFGCRQAKQVIEDTFRRYNKEPPEKITIRYSSLGSSATRDSVIYISLEYDIPFGVGITNFLSQVKSVTYSYTIPVERFNSRYENAWKECRS